jgi:hydroxymethylglutaryl-CoA lyase
MVDKLAFAQQLVEAGIRDLELGAFVRPDQVPQMADSDRIFSAIIRKKSILHSARAWCLIPNQFGLGRALAVGARNFALFTAATDGFVEKNIGMSISESLREFKRVLKMARGELGSKFQVRGYVSTAFGCPFEGRVAPKKALRVIEALAELSVDQISVGDTIGVANPKAVQDVIQPALRQFGSDQIAVHFHDTRGTALANTLRALDLGVRVVDSSFGGLGGCPFAPGAAGNLPTEDLVYMLNGMNMKTGVDLDLLCRISIRLSKKLKRPITSRYVQAFINSKCE